MGPSAVERARSRLAAVLIVPGHVAEEINGLRRALRSNEIGKIQPHITIVPPVNVAEAEIGSATALMRNVAARFGPIAVELGPASSFLPHNPVCYLEVSGDREVLSALGDLVAQLGTGPLSPPANRRTRPFVPHVTINQKMDRGLIPGAVAALSGYKAHVVFERVTLISFVEAERRWVEIADAMFGRPLLVGRGGREVELAVSDRLDPGAQLWSDSAWDQYSQEQYGSHVRPYDHFAITARSAGEIVGVADGELRGVVCRLAHLLVAPDQRSSGIGAQLLRATEMLAVEKRCQRVRLETLKGGRAEGFYSGKGYEIVARLPRWREGRDFVVMERAVEAPPPS